MNVSIMADSVCPQPITISAILSYCGSALDVGINYSLLAINVVGFGAFLHNNLWAHSRSGTDDFNSSSSSCSHPAPSLGSTLLSLSFGEYGALLVSDSGGISREIVLQCVNLWCNGTIVSNYSLTIVLDLSLFK